jgi:UDP-glucose 4-epimerase
MNSVLKGKRILLTGGAGFIGSHMLRRLLVEDVAEVVVVDSLEYGVSQHIPKDARVRLINLPLESPQLPIILAGVGHCDYLIHLAARKHNQSSHTPNELFAANIFGTHQIIILAAKLGVQKAIFSSSLYAYGRWEGPSMREDELPHPNTLYGISKLAGEHLFEWGLRTHGIPYVIVRYFFVYGPRQYPGLGYKSVIVKNFERMYVNEPAIIRGDGLQTLDYIYVDDAIEGTLHALLSSHSAEVFNIGSGVGVTIRELTNQMFAAADKQPAVIFESADKTHDSSRVGNIEKARTLLDFSARTTLREGLAATYTWLKQRLINS